MTSHRKIKSFKEFSKLRVHIFRVIYKIPVKALNKFRGGIRDIGKIFHQKQNLGNDRPFRMQISPKMCQSLAIKGKEGRKGLKFLPLNFTIYLISLTFALLKIH